MKPKYKVGDILQFKERGKISFYVIDDVIIDEYGILYVDSTSGYMVDERMEEEFSDLKFKIIDSNDQIYKEYKEYLRLKEKFE